MDVLLWKAETGGECVHADSACQSEEQEQNYD